MPNAYASPSRSFLQILDFDNAASEVKTTRWELETTLPERAGGGVRWMYATFVLFFVQSNVYDANEDDG